MDVCVRYHFGTFSSKQRNSVSTTEHKFYKLQFKEFNTVSNFLIVSTHFNVHVVSFSVHSKGTFCQNVLVTLEGANESKGKLDCSSRRSNHSATRTLLAYLGYNALVFQ